MGQSVYKRSCAADLETRMGTKDCVVRHTLLMNTAVSAAKSLHNKQGETYSLHTLDCLAT